MKKNVIVIVAVLLVTSRNLFADVQSRTNGVELLQGLGCIRSVSSTQTNLIITFRSDGFIVRRDGKTRGTGEYVENNEALVVTPDEEIVIAAYGGGIALTPISFKNGEKGFRIRSGPSGFSPDGGMKRDFAYLALGDAPTPMSADDVEMIWDSRLDRTGNPTGWRRFEGDQAISYPIAPPVQAKPPEPPSEPPAVTPPEPIETPVNIAEDEPSEEKSKTTTLWLYAIIPLGLLVILYLMRRKPTS